MTVPAAAINLILRGGFLLSRLALLILAARMLSVESYAVLVIFSGLIVISIYLVGFDIYNYTLRELVKGDIAQRSLIATQFKLHVAQFVLFSLVAVVFLPNFIAKPYLFFFFPILFFDHQNQEGYRILTALSRPVLASALHFLRGAAWIPAALLHLSILKPSDPLLVLLTYWLCFSVMGFLSHAILLRQLSREDSAGTPAVVGEYYKVGWVYLVGTLAVQACFTIDKSILALHASDEQVAVYGFCASLAYSLVTLVEAAVVSVGYPALMRAVSQRQSPGRQLLEFGCRIVIVYVVVAILLVAAFPYVVDLVGKPLYGESRSLLYLMVIAYFFYCLQYPAHYGLYARGRDGTIVVLDVLGGALFIAMAVLLAVDIGAIGMALAVLLGFLGVAGLKTFNLNRVLKFDG